MYILPNLNGATLLIGANKGVITQALLDTVAGARTFDIHGFTGYTKDRNKTLLAIGKLVTELAQLCNFTPKAIPLGNPSVAMKLFENESNSGILIPFVVPSVVSPHFTPLSKTKASVMLSVYQYFNFLYCAQSENVLRIDMKVIALPFDKYIWMLLILSVILITVFGSYAIIPRDATAMALTSVGALFSQTTSATRATTNYYWKNRSFLLLLWIACCFVLNNLYSGVVTSILVAPVEPDVIKTVDGLVSRNYRLASHDQFKYVFKMTEKIALGQKPNSSLRSLVQTVVIFPSAPQFMEGLAFQRNLAMFAPYMVAMAFWQILTERNSVAWKRTRKPQLRNRYCHLGKELSSTHSLPEVWIFRMKQQQLSKELGHTFSRIDSVGIHDYWMKVFFRLQVTRRAQNIYRFKSKTEVKEDLPVEPLNLHKGSIVVIFVMYALCTCICVVLFLGENLYKRCMYVNRPTTVTTFLH